MSSKALPPLSQRSLALLTGMSRDSIRSALAAINLQPVGTAGGHPIYDPGEALRGLFQSRANADPDSLRPFERRQHFEAELRKLELQKRRGEVCLREDVRQAAARAYAICASNIRSIPDNLERKAGLSSELAEHCELVINEILNTLADDLERVVREAEALEAQATKGTT